MHPAILNPLEDVVPPDRAIRKETVHSILLVRNTSNTVWSFAATIAFKWEGLRFSSFNDPFATLPRPSASISDKPAKLSTTFRDRLPSWLISPDAESLLNRRGSLADRESRFPLLGVWKKLDPYFLAQHLLFLSNCFGYLPSGASGTSR
jgi:hypothetical protein